MFTYNKNDVLCLEAQFNPAAMKVSPSHSHSVIQFQFDKENALHVFYITVHHGHSPGVIELNSEQFAQRHDVHLSGKSYGDWHFEQ